MDKGMGARIGDDNASTSPRNLEDAAPAGASRAPADPTKPYWFKGNPDHLATREDEREDMASGNGRNGKGSDVIISFNPASIITKKVFDRS